MTNWRPCLLAHFAADSYRFAGVFFLVLRLMCRIWNTTAVDSILFPTIAFGSFLPLIVLGQFAAKVGGGFVWSLLLNRRTK